MLITQIIKSQTKILGAIVICAILSIFAIDSVSAQQKMVVQGTVTSIPGNKPIPYARVVHNGNNIASSDIDGKFTIKVEGDAKITFMHSGYNNVTINVERRQIIDVAMTEHILVLKDVVVVSKKKKQLTVEPTDIEIKGNYFYLRTRFRIPSTLLTSDKRFVIQPTIYDATRKERINLRPVIIDGDNYTIVQHRHLNFDDSNDKLADYIVDNRISRKNDIYTYADSLYFDKNSINNDFRADCYLTVVGYHDTKKVTPVDTVTIARGLLNVMRFFSILTPPMNLDKSLVTSGVKASLNIGKIDSAFMPSPDIKLRSSTGTTDIDFETGKSTINYSNAKNRRNIDKITNALREIQKDENASIKSISITGHASPDGVLSKNHQLADLRTREISRIVTRNIHKDVLKYIKVTSKGIVEPWSKVVDIARSDNPDIAYKLESILGDDRISNQQWSIKRLPEYRTIIAPKYLPQLRKIEYLIDYSTFRKLSDGEIVERHRQNKELSRYEYFKLILIEKNDKKREKIEDEAVKAFPNFTWAINRVAIRLILRKEVNLELQKPVLDAKLPMTMVYNQTVMALMDNERLLADSLVSTITQYPEVDYLSAVVKAYNGNYEEAYPVISKRGGLNEVIILLGLKYNDKAFERVDKLIQDPKNSKNASVWYVHAICSNRLNDVMTAISSLTMALQLDPSLVEVAELDSDVMDIYKIIESLSKEESMKKEAKNE